MRIDDVFALRNGILSCDELSNPNGNFTSKLALAFHIIDPIVKAVDKSKPKRSKSLQEFDKKSRDLIFKYAIQDENGNLKMEGNMPLVTKPIEYHNELRALEENYKSDIEEYDALLETWNVIFDQNVTEFTNSKEITLPIIKRNEFPKDITVKQVRGIVLLIERDTEK